MPSKRSRSFSSSRQNLRHGIERTQVGGVAFRFHLAVRLSAVRDDGTHLGSRRREPYAHCPRRHPEDARTARAGSGMHRFGAIADRQTRVKFQPNEPTTDGYPMSSPNRIIVKLPTRSIRIRCTAGSVVHRMILSIIQHRQTLRSAVPSLLDIQSRQRRLLDVRDSVRHGAAEAGVITRHHAEVTARV